MSTKRDMLEIPKDKASLMNLINVIEKNASAEWLQAWCERISEEDKKRILEAKPNFIFCFIPKGYVIFNPNESKKIGQVLRAMPREYLNVELINSILEHVIGEMKQNKMYASTEGLCKKTIISNIVDIDYENLNIEIIKYLVENAEDSELAKLNFPNTPEVFELMKTTFGEEFALTFVNPNSAETAKIEDLLAKLKDSSLEKFEKVLFALTPEKQTETMYKMYLEITKYRGSEEVKKGMSNISLELLTPQLLEKMYKVYPSIWEVIPKEKQTEELLYVAIQNESDVFKFMKNLDIKSAEVMRAIISRVTTPEESKSKKSSKYSFDDDDEDFEYGIEFEKEEKDASSEICHLLKYMKTTDVDGIRELMFALNLDTEEALKKYIELSKRNEGINSTLNLKILDSKFNFFSLEEMLRITAHPFVQESIISNSNNKTYLNILKRITEISEDSIAVIENFNSNMQFYMELFEDEALASSIEADADGTLTEILIKMCINNQVNYFNVDNVDKLKDFEHVRYETCMKIIDGEDIRLNDSYAMELVEVKKFAILQLLYGIDYDEALNLARKYGEDIESIPTTENSNDENVKEFIRSISTIINLNEEELDKLLENNEFKEVLKNSKARDLGNITDIEHICIDMYVNLYQKEIFKLDSDLARSLKHDTVKYNGKDVEIIELRPEIDENGHVIKPVEFIMLGRVEGAYGELEVPEDYAKYFKQASVTYHGNCESAIAHDLIALASPQEGSQIFGYSDASGMLLQAPWDISTRTTNDKMSITNSRAYLGNGVQFNTPRNLIQNTRFEHNEVVSDRIVYNSDAQEISRRMPAYVIYLKNNYDDVISEETKKAASDLQIPIVVIDREAFAIQENEKISNCLEILEGKRENNTGLNNRELMKRIITSFETNRVGMKFAESLKNKYFTDYDRKLILDKIMTVIENNPNREEQTKDAISLMEITEEEKEKVFSSNDKIINEDISPEYNRVRGFLKKLGIEYTSKISIVKREMLVEYGLENPEDLQEDREKIEHAKGRISKKSIDSMIKGVRMSEVNVAMEKIVAGLEGKERLEDKQIK